MALPTTTGTGEVEHVACDRCGLPHVRVTVWRVRCQCAGTGFVAVPGPWGGWEYPCESCPGDGWVWVFSGIEVDRQVRACQVSGAAPRLREVAA